MSTCAPSTLAVGIGHRCVRSRLRAAVAYYRDVLGFTVLSPPYVMDGDAIRADMGELRADGSDARRAADLADPGLTHVGLICDDLDETRKSLEDKGVRFLVDGFANIAGVRTTWFADPWGVVFILV
jgi:catechol 2,3-dioxygenase-like lactoylglutathione lyase family enzyme